MPVTVLRVPFLADLPGSSRIIEHWEHFPSGINVGIIFYKFHQHPVNKDRNGKYPNRTCVFLFSFQSPWWINGLSSKIIRCKISSTQEDMQPKRKKNPVQIFHFSLILQLFSSYGYNSGSEKDVRSAWGTQCWNCYILTTAGAGVSLLPELSLDYRSCCVSLPVEQPRAASASLAVLRGTGSAFCSSPLSAVPRATICIHTTEHKDGRTHHRQTQSLIPTSDSYQISEERGRTQVLSRCFTPRVHLASNKHWTS